MVNLKDILHSQIFSSHTIFDKLDPRGEKSLFVFLSKLTLNRYVFHLAVVTDHGEQLTTPPLSGWKENNLQPMQKRSCKTKGASLHSGSDICCLCNYRKQVSLLKSLYISNAEQAQGGCPQIQSRKT